MLLVNLLQLLGGGAPNWLVLQMAVGPAARMVGQRRGGRLGCKAPLGPASWAGGNTRAGPTAPRAPGGKWHTPPVPPARAAGGWVATRPRQHARRVGGGGAAVIDS